MSVENHTCCQKGDVVLKKGFLLLFVLTLVLGLFGVTAAKNPLYDNPDYKAGYEYGKEIAKTQGVKTSQSYHGSYLSTRDSASIALLYCEGKSAEFKSGFMNGFDQAASNRYVLGMLVMAGVVTAIYVVIMLL